MIYPNIANNVHDCLSELINANAEISEELNGLEGLLGHSVSEDLTCPNGKSLTVKRGMVAKLVSRRGNSQINCRTCANKSLDMRDLYYACSDLKCNCNYWICQPCGIKSYGLDKLAADLKKTHDHPMVLERPEKKWKCCNA